MQNYPACKEFCVFFRYPRLNQMSTMRKSRRLLHRPRKTKTDDIVDNKNYSMHNTDFLYKCHLAGIGELCEITRFYLHGFLSLTLLTPNAPITTKFICFSRLLKCLRSLYGKQCGPRSDCSYSSLFWVHTVCFYT